MAISRYLLAFSLAILCGASRAQNCYPTADGSVYGVPVCTGFHVYSNLEDHPVMNFKGRDDDKELRKALKLIEREVDSLKKEAAKLRDSLMHQSWDMKSLFGNMSDTDLFSIPLSDMKELQKLDSLHIQIPDLFNLPNYIEGNTIVPHFFDEKNFNKDDKMIRRMPAPKKQEPSIPIPNFPDWKMQKLSKDMGSRL
jgi:hypothetical protein